MRQILVSFDSVPVVHHAGSIVRVIRRVAAMAAVLTLSLGNVAVCAGWQATPEARMACCHDDASCPTHKPESHGSGSKRHVTQTEADNCCAASERNDPATTGVSLVAAATFALAPATIAHVVIPKIPVLQECRAFVPPASSIRKHLLLSVLLI